MDAMNEYLAVELFDWVWVEFGQPFADHPKYGQRTRTLIPPEYIEIFNYDPPPDDIMELPKSRHCYCRIPKLLKLDKWEGAGMVIEKMREIGNNELFGEFVCELAEALGATEDDWIIAAHYLMMGLTPETVARAAAAALGMEDEDD